MKKQLFQLDIIGWMTVISALFLFACSSIRHTLYQSGVLDLGIYDQVVYLISQGQPPISSFLGFHHMGNHAAWAVYPLALLYKIYPSAYWLLAVQAVSLALGAVPTYYLALQAGLKESQAVAIAAVYLLYPLIFNVNLFEFHPEVMAIPVFLGVVLAARLGKIGWFCLGTIFILGCKAVLSLTVTAMGFWLLVFERRRFYGTFALIAGISWFLVASQVIIPFFSNSEVAAVSRYSYLGDSVIAIASNLLLKPNIVLERVFSLKTLEYLALLVAPLIWGLTPKHLTPLVSAIPALVLNILSDKSAQRDLIHQYSLPILPFLIVAVIASLAADKGWLRTRRAIILWALLAFMVLGKYGYFWSRYLRTVDNWQATTEAIAQVQTKGAVLTTHSIAPHLSHRPMIQFVDDISGPPASFTPFDYILLNVRHPDGTRNPEFAANLVNQLKNHQLFQLVYQRDDVYLFVKRSQ
ncbi:hypothetical protein CEN50_05500 [Fischerella thermalis CCMEE 5268]|uniref:DUF2079 domain-containing protein n=1 Tax=Fischerella thermalis CCMEE 5268 TaxID=2019662 RepID=A0A2N6KJR7_9CYAN|nr:DUF2079 domain-containing protein [Fischerella thermalis]PLZ99873.1 hypothetical protein CEN50_05500 [Fischerella thermalis CCMEE 5268]